MPKRCELGCTYKPGLTYHSFPHPKRNPDGFKAWVQVVGGILETEADFELYKKKVICDVHFTDKFKNRYNRLNALAVPTLHLYGSPENDATREGSATPEFDLKQPTLNSNLSDSFENISTQVSPTPAASESGDEPSTSISALADSSDNIPSEVSATPEPGPDQPSPSKSALAEFLDNFSKTISSDLEPEFKLPAIPIRWCVVKRKPQPQVNEGLNIPSEDFQTVKIDFNQPPTSTETESPPEEVRHVAAEHNYSRHENKCVKQPRNAIPDPSLLDDQFQFTRNRIRHLESEVRRLRMKNEMYKEKLASINKNNNKYYLRKITKNMTNAARIFIEMQYHRSLKKRSTVRKFTLKERAFSLSLYEKSPEGYNLLTKYFTLPSVNDLKRLMGNTERE